MYHDSDFHRFFRTVRLMRANEILDEDALSQVTDDLFEMANLRQNQTGIPGTVYISTRQASGAMVKYYVDRPGGTPSFSVSIGPNPEVVENSLPQNVMSRMSPLVIEWVKLNHDKLTQFWNQGTTWFDDEVNSFKASLVKISRRRKP
jgi:hypothetical protein